MKKLFKITITLTLTIMIVLGFTLPANPPGWDQQVLPVNDQINDIFFLNSSTGWIVTDGRTNTNDTGYIMKTTNGGENWAVVYNQPMKLTGVQFLDANTGYVIGGSGSGTGRIFKTVNGGTNWNMSTVLGLGDLEDMCFINKDTGWVCDANTFGGLAKTTNGGVNWQIQLNDSYSPKRIFMLNKDTGWVGNNHINGSLYRTTNGGTNWTLHFTFAQQINDIYFFNINTGVVASGFSYKTTNGGSNWIQTNEGGTRLTFVNDTVGWAGSNFDRIRKTTDGGSTWHGQTTPIFDNTTIFAVNETTAWAGGSGLVKTTDGGGPFVGIEQISNEIPTEFILYQNYPNPFNPTTNIKYQIVNNKNVKLVIFDIAGKEIAILVNDKQSAGTYKADWDASGFSSGIYFYSLIIEGRVNDTKKMVLVK